MAQWRVDVVYDLFRYLMDWNWPAVITALSTAALAIAAFRALGTWKKQICVQRKIEWLDRLSESVDEMVIQLGPAVRFAAWISQTIDFYEHSIHVQSSDSPHKIPAYLKNSGKHDSEKLAHYLSPCASAAITMQSSLEKGKAMKLKDFDNCFNACQRIYGVYERLSYVQGTLASNLDRAWVNPDVQQQLKNILNINAEELATQISGAKTHVAEFRVANYTAMGLAC